MLLRASKTGSCIPKFQYLSRMDPTLNDMPTAFLTRGSRALDWFSGTLASTSVYDW